MSRFRYTPNNRELVLIRHTHNFYSGVVRHLLPTLLLLLLPVTVTSLFAAELTGAEEFRQHCSGCHGQHGTGNGKFTDQLSVRPPDLTRISNRHGGIFPVEKMIRIIDGRLEVDSHGARDMPVWGARFSLSAQDSVAVAVPEETIRERIMKLVYYLQSIQ